MAQPRAREGQLKVTYGAINRDIMICNGSGTAKADAHLLFGAFVDRTLNADLRTAYNLELDKKMGPSVLEQLMDRGYDPRTLKITINKMESSGE